jgi:hypothetical protein
MQCGLRTLPGAEVEMLPLYDHTHPRIYGANRFYIPLYGLSFVFRLTIESVGVISVIWLILSGGEKNHSSYTAASQ